MADRDAAELFAALDDDRVWRHLAGRPGDADGWAALIAGRAPQAWCTWIVRLREAGFGLSGGAVVGTTSYLEVCAEDARLEIGSTAYVPAVWATRVNPETKLLLLGYAFDELGVGRVQLKTDIRNVRSAQAIARLGAQFEGTLRRYQRRADATVRDTVLFSIVAEQWPQVRAGLLERLHGGD
jgi:RimJ/RimL family protein N-acetyltransferase